MDGWMDGWIYNCACLHDSMNACMHACTIDLLKLLVDF